MNLEKYDDLKDVIFNLDIEGTIFYPNEDNRNDFFIAWAMSVITIDEDDQDCEFEILNIIKSELSDDKLIFTNIGDDYETHRIIGLPKIQYFEFENSMSSLIEETNIKAAIEFLINLKTINFSDLKSENNNFKFIKSNETEIEKTYYSTGELKDEFETVNGLRHGFAKGYHINGQLRVTVEYKNGIQADGIVESFDENGSLIRSVFIKNGNLNGPFNEYYPSGILKRKGEYIDDQIIGKSIEYFEDGNIKDEFYIVNGVNIESSTFEQSDFYKFFIKETEEVLLNLDIKEKLIYDLFYDLETIQTTIIIGDKENIILKFAEIRIYTNKCEDQDDEHDSIGEIETPFIISYSCEIEDYILLTNFPEYIIDEDADDMNSDTGIRNLTFYELVNSFNEMKVIDMSKIEIDDSDDFTYFEDGNIIDETHNNNIVKNVETNNAFIREIDNFTANHKIDNFDLEFNISKWYGHTPSNYSGEFEGYKFKSELLEVYKWGVCEHSYTDLNKFKNDLKDYEIEELHKHLAIDIISEDENFEIGSIEWDVSTPQEFIEDIEEEWGPFEIMDYSTEEEQFEIIYKEGTVINEIQLILSSADTALELHWKFSKENEKYDKVISALKHASDNDKDILNEAINKISNAHTDNDKSYDYYDNGQYQEGIDSVNKALDIIPENSGFLDTLALGYYYLGEYNLALEISNKCIEIDSNKNYQNPEHYTNRAKIYLKLNNKENAFEDLKTALELDPDNEEAIDLLQSLK